MGDDRSSNGHRLRRIAVAMLPVGLLAAAALGLGPLAPSGEHEPTPIPQTVGDLLAHRLEVGGLADSIPAGRLVVQEGLYVRVLTGDGHDVAHGGLVARDISPDGRSVLATTGRSGSLDRFPGSQLATLDLHTGAREVVSRTGGGEGIGHAAWGPDGRFAHDLFRFRPMDEAPGVWAKDEHRLCVSDPAAEGRGCVRLPDGLMGLDWSVARDAVLATGAPLRLLDPATHTLTDHFSPNEHVVRGGGGSVHEAAWSPSGEFATALPNTGELIVVDGDGRPVHRSTVDVAGQPALVRWHPTEDLLAVRTTVSDHGRLDSRHEIHLFDPARDTWRPLDAARIRGRITSIAWSADGGRLAFFTWPQRVPTTTLWVVDVEADRRSAHLNLTDVLGLDPRARIVGWVP